MHYTTFLKLKLSFALGKIHICEVFGRWSPLVVTRGWILNNPLETFSTVTTRVYAEKVSSLNPAILEIFLCHVVTSRSHFRRVLLLLRGSLI